MCFASRTPEKLSAPKTGARDSRCGARLFGRIAILWCAVLSASGCGYNIGAPFQAEIQSIYVPIFTSTSYRRNLEYQLTEAVHKEIQKQSHFRLVKEPQADTRLTGHIIDVRKERLGENGYDDPRELQMQFSVEVTWEDLRTGQILVQQRLPISPEAVDRKS
ncbi:MAG: LPS assembly lipoprotein LptE, partial [Planctomycetaceae bacterium]